MSKLFAAVVVTLGSAKPTIADDRPDLVAAVNDLPGSLESIAEMGNVAVRITYSIFDSLIPDRAQELGVKIACENMSPNRRIIAGTETSYALDLVVLARQLEDVGHPSVTACLDVSHAQ